MRLSCLIVVVVVLGKREGLKKIIDGGALPIMVLYRVSNKKKVYLKTG